MTAINMGRVDLIKLLPLLDIFLSEENIGLGEIGRVKVPIEHVTSIRVEDVNPSNANSQVSSFDSVSQKSSGGI